MPNGRPWAEDVIPGVDDGLHWLGRLPSPEARRQMIDRLQSLCEQKRRLKDELGDVTAELASAIFFAHDRLLPIRQIARHAGVSRRTVYNILADYDSVLD